MSGYDDRWLRAALRLAKQGLGSTAANPSVGCVIAKDGIALGRGRTGHGGRPHAERRALDDALNRWGVEPIKGATAYVTLEPCAHTGKTPPCTDALIESGISRVVVPISDPDPRVSGKGFALLRAAGIEVESGMMEAAARDILRGYLSRVERQRPFLTLKLASTLDGRIATRTGKSRWITGPDARERVHLLRAQSDGVLIGIGSVLADDPALDVRLPGWNGALPARIVVDTRLQTPLTGRLARTADKQPLILLTAHEAEASRVQAFKTLGATVIGLPLLESGGLSMTEGFKHLSQVGIGAVLCEGGGRLAAGLMVEGLVDELVWFTAGAVLGRGGAASVADFGIEELARMPRFSMVKRESLANDVMTVWRPE